MPESGRNAGRADEFYAVARSISNTDWNRFARGSLGLPESVIDDISVDHSKNVAEQKYQMIRKWEQREGRDATVENLKVLRDSFLGRSTDGQQTPEITEPAMQSVPRNDNLERAEFRSLLVNVGNRLTVQQFNTAKMIYGNIDGSSEDIAAVYFSKMDEHTLWGNTMPEKLDRVEQLMVTLMVDNVRHSDLFERINRMKRTFDDGDREQPATAAAAQQSSGNQSSRASSSQSNTSSHSGSYQNSPSTVASQSSSARHDASVPTVSHSESSLEQTMQHSGSYRDGSSFGMSNQSAPPQTSSNRSASYQNEQYYDMSKSRASQSVGAQPFRIGDSLTATDGPSPATTESLLETTQSDARVEATEQTVAQESRAFVGIPTSNRRVETNDICTYVGTDVKVVNSTEDFFLGHLSNRDNVYQVQRKPKGYAIIFSNIDFPVWGPAHKRKGGEKDCKLMEKLFGENGLGLKTLVYENLSREAMWSTLQAFALDGCHADASMCVVVIMSHGLHITEGDAIYGTDGRHLLADNIVRLFDNDNCPNLRLKPKMFFFQFCRGSQADRGVLHNTDRSLYPLSGDLSSVIESLNAMDTGSSEDEADDIEHLPSRSDVLIAFATQEGNLSFRSWFTNALANVFSQHAHNMHVTEMLNMVKRGLALKVSSAANPHIDCCKEMADVRDILLKNIYFFPGFL